MAIGEKQPKDQLEAAIDHLGRIAPDSLPDSTEPTSARAERFRAANSLDNEARIAIAAVELIASGGEEPHHRKALSFIESAWSSAENRRLLLARQLGRYASRVAGGSQDILDAAEDLRGVISILCSARLSLLGREDVANELRAIADKRHGEIAAAAGLAAQVMAFRGGSRARKKSQ